MSKKTSLFFVSFFIMNWRYSSKPVKNCEIKITYYGKYDERYSLYFRPKISHIIRYLIFLTQLEFCKFHTRRCTKLIRRIATNIRVSNSLRWLNLMPRGCRLSLKSYPIPNQQSSWIMIMLQWWWKNQNKRSRKFWSICTKTFTK